MHYLQSVFFSFQQNCQEAVLIYSFIYISFNINLNIYFNLYTYMYTHTCTQLFFFCITFPFFILFLSVILTLSFILNEISFFGNLNMSHDNFIFYIQCYTLESVLHNNREHVILEKKILHIFNRP